MNKALRTAGLAALCAGGFTSAMAFDPATQAKGTAPEKTQKIRFIEDDAQDYM